MTETPQSATDPATCPHTEATLDAEVTDPTHPDIPHLSPVLTVLKPGMENFKGARVQIGLGTCRACRTAVVTVNLVHPEHMDASSAALSTGWVPLRPFNLSGVPGVVAAQE